MPAEHTAWRKARWEELAGRSLVLPLLEPGRTVTVDFNQATSSHAAAYLRFGNGLITRVEGYACPPAMTG